MFSPFALTLCFAPIAAWSCFSTADIWPVNFLISAMEDDGAVCPLTGWVEGSLSCSTILSTSSNLPASSAYAFVKVCNVASIYTSGCGFDLVLRWSVFSFELALSSNVINLSTKFSIMPSKCTIYVYYYLCTSLWSSISDCNYVISSAISF